MMPWAEAGGITRSPSPGKRTGKQDALSGGKSPVFAGF